MYLQRCQEKIKNRAQGFTLDPNVTSYFILNYNEEATLPYTIKKLAEMAGVSVRTLHHYDAIGLVTPGSRSASGYRLYGEEELLRLQQVLFYRELDMSLEEIGRILDRPDYDPVAALEAQARLLTARALRIARLIDTVGRTIGRIKGESMLSDEELYAGFDKAEIEKVKAEAKERWGGTEAYAQSQRRVAKMSRDEWAKVIAEGEAVDRAAAEAMRRGDDPASASAQSIMARKFEHLRAFYEPTPEMFAGLGRMYVEDERFKKRYEDLAHGLADYLGRAMAAFAAGR
jgi:DNA-binding transcriptional MerR regulator